MMTKDNVNSEDEKLETVPDVQILERAEAREDGVPLFAAHWHLYIPTIIIAALYSLIWLMLFLTGNAGTDLARLFVVVMTVGVPLLAAHAFLRYQTIRIQVNEDNVICHPGWPRDLPSELPAQIIESVQVKRGLSGNLFGGGTVIFKLVTGDRMAIADVGDPDAAANAVSAMLARTRKF